MALEMGVSATPPLAQCRHRRARSAPFGSHPDPEGGAPSGHRLRNRHPGHVSYLPTLVCHPSAGARPRQPHDSRADGPQRHQHHHGLHARAEPRTPGRRQSSRPFVTARTLIGGPVHGSRNGSDLREPLCGAGGLEGSCRLCTPA